jgi:hypothetical protein
MQEENLIWREERMIDNGKMRNGWMITRNSLLRIVFVRIIHKKDN